MPSPPPKAPARRIPLRSALIALLVVACAAMAIYQIPRVRAFAIVGSVTASDADIIAATGIVLGQHFFEINLDEVKVNLQRNPRYRSVAVHFRLPATFEVVLEESESDARLLKNDEDIVIDRNGLVIFIGQASDKRNIPQVLGMSISGYKEGAQLGVSDEYQLWAMRQVLNTLYDGGYATTYALIDLSDPVDIKMMNYQRITVHMGQMEGLVQKLDRAERVLAELEDQGLTGGVLDVSTDQTAYRPAGENEIFVPEEWNQWLPPALGAQAVFAEEPETTDEPIYAIESDLPPEVTGGPIVTAVGETTGKPADNGSTWAETTPRPTEKPKPKTTPKPTIDPAEAFGIPDENAP